MHSRRPPIIHDSLDPWNIVVHGEGACQIVDLGPGKMTSCMSTEDVLSDNMRAFRPNDSTPSKAADVYALAKVAFFVSSVNSTQLVRFVDRGNEILNPRS